jgi:hypothetical protein
LPASTATSDITPPPQFAISAPSGTSVCEIEAQSGLGLDRMPTSETEALRSAPPDPQMAELTARFGEDPQPVRKILWKLERTASSPETGLLLAQALMILEETAEPGPARIPRWSEVPLDVLLPEERPRPAIGGDYTVRRPVPKLGRNDPCHCGSGRK